MLLVHTNIFLAYQVFTVFWDTTADIVSICEKIERSESLGALACSVSEILF